MELLFCLLLGYFLGSASPAAWLARRHHVDLREEGTCNLGASNATLVLGRRQGIIVLLFDVFKAYTAARLASWLFPRIQVSGLLAGTAAVAGHIFPFHLNFRGGKGLACFAGLILSYNTRIFWFLAIFCVGLMLLVNYSFVVPLSSAVLFPLFSLLHSKDVLVFLVCAAAGTLVFVKNVGNVQKELQEESVRIRTNLRNIFLTGKES